jgi:hypothetical protein
MPFNKRRKYSKRSRSRRGKYSRGRRTYRIATKAAKRVLNRKIETKHASFGGENFALYHNNQIGAGNDQPFSVQGIFNCWTFITPGTAVTNRVGNEIMPRGFSMRLYLENMPDRPNLHYRIIMGAAPKLKPDNTPSTWDNLGTLLDAGSRGNLVRHMSTDQGFKIFHDRVYRNELGNCNDGTGNTKRCHKFLKFWIKRKKASKIIYQSSATGVVAPIINKPFFCVIIAYDSYNTLITDIVARYDYQCKLYWKDA